MHLPNYFFADLQDSSAITPALVTEACRTLKRNRARFLEHRSTESIINLLATVARDWLDDGYIFRKMVLENGPGQTGFSRETLAARLDKFFAQITRENLTRLVEQDLGHTRRFDEMVSDESEMAASRASIARGPDLLVQITGGVLPNPVITSMILGLLARSAQFIKCATGTSYIPRIFAHSIYIVERKLGACLEIAEWPGGSEALEGALFDEASHVTATGSDETLTTIRKRLPAKVRFTGYGHRLSFAFVANEMLARINIKKLVQESAEDVVAWNQLGCLSPHVIYVETGGAVAPQAFAEMLAKELQERELKEPRGDLRAQEAAAIATRRMFYQVRAATTETTRLWASENSTAWTVVFEEDPEFQTSCLSRFIFVKPVATFDQLFLATAAIQNHVSTVGLSSPVNRAQELATQFAQWGATRICPIGRMQDPPLAWRHDGRPALADLVTWADWEF